MSNRMTSVSLRGAIGFADYGRRDPKEMINRLREIAASQKAEAEAILSASDQDFQVETYVGVFAQRNRVILQRGK